MTRIKHLVILGIVLDLAVSGVLGWYDIRLRDQQRQLSKVQTVSQCWNHVLDEAVRMGPLTRSSRVKVNSDARKCLVTQVTGKRTDVSVPTP